jgi:hypothetical protein
MDKDSKLTCALEASAKRRDQRRDFLKLTGGATIALGASSALAACFDSGKNQNGGAPTDFPPPTPTPAPGPIGDADIFNFALNLEYLEASFYSYAAFGVGLSANQITGTGAFGSGSITPGRQVNFTDPVVRQYAKEIAADEVAHVNFIRSVLGSSAVAEPNLDLGVGPNNAFSVAARAAGLIGAGQSFDPYASDENFLLAAFIFEDVGVTAYKGASPLISNKTYLEAAAGILAAEAYHAGLIRTTLYAKGINTPALRTSADAISNARDSLDGASDDDQGISPVNNVANIVPSDGNGIAYSRNTGQVLNIAYLNKLAVMRGGFFPDGVNGRINTSQAN